MAAHFVLLRLGGAQIGGLPSSDSLLPCRCRGSRARSVLVSWWMPRCSLTSLGSIFCSLAWGFLLGRANLFKACMVKACSLFRGVSGRTVPRKNVSAHGFVGS